MVPGVPADQGGVAVVLRTQVSPSVSWPRRSSCKGCGRIFWRFVEWNEYCTPSCARAHGRRAV